MQHTSASSMPVMLSLGAWIRRSSWTPSCHLRLHLPEGLLRSGFPHRSLWFFPVCRANVPTSESCCFSPKLSHLHLRTVPKSPHSSFLLLFNISYWSKHLLWFLLSKHINFLYISLSKFDNSGPWIRIVYVIGFYIFKEVLLESCFVVKNLFIA